MRAFRSSPLALRLDAALVGIDGQGVHGVQRLARVAARLFAVILGEQNAVAGGQSPAQQVALVRQHLAQRRLALLRLLRGALQPFAPLRIGAGANLTLARLEGEKLGLILQQPSSRALTRGFARIRTGSERMATTSPSLTLSPTSHLERGDGTTRRRGHHQHPALPWSTPLPVTLSGAVAAWPRPAPPER